MMQQWFSQSAVSVVPDAIILPTTSLLNQFVRRVQMLAYEDMRSELIERQGFVVECLIQALQYDHKVQTEIMCGAMDIMRHEFNIHDREEAGLVASAMMELAEGIYNELQRIHAYQNGYLYYQYHSLDGRDVVMIRLSLPEIHAKGNHGRPRRW